jgi:hypothetical protein
MAQLKATYVEVVLVVVFCGPDLFDALELDRDGHAKFLPMSVSIMARGERPTTMLR